MLWTDREISFFHFLLWEVLGVLWKWDFLSFPITINCNLFSYLDDAVDWWINSCTSVAGMLSNKYCSSIHILLGICRIQYQALETSANLPAEEDPTFDVKLISGIQLGPCQVKRFEAHLPALLTFTFDPSLTFWDRATIGAEGRVFFAANVVSCLRGAREFADFWAVYFVLAIFDMLLIADDMFQGNFKSISTITWS